ncbi:GNAT family N-acetyltransferase [Leifsonia shinshuensis]|uniref:GNAT family N-acetyltransferase n=1 Tax=Leifsonia shinshuensis TaxID=150026 RepID=A0A7G6YEF9_9MICO|nr:GNAT family N-acetyltransferase [Leifsonia shinshuensis]QNE36874.1 GNAT family N-acetyltransferase [Leifsonia shinshuensis]
MAHLDGVTWPPVPISTGRLVLRATEPRDREAMLDLWSSPEAHLHLGGATPRAELDALVPETPGKRTGFFAIELDGELIGIVTFDPRAADRPGHVLEEGGEADLGYLLLPHAWGRGYATEACAAAMGWFRAAAPDEPLVVSTQLANTASRRVLDKLGFAEVERHEEFGEPQWFGVWTA